MLAEVARIRGNHAPQDVQVGSAEFFVESRLSLGTRVAHPRRQGFAPELIVADMVDHLGLPDTTSLGCAFRLGDRR
ncbi:hypothetical protein [Streptomyces sp. 2A115]|uniref:hypothetical protein n=1 Tax=Streptomyces sp. 2A115 TaxID=3457439 RepID=UPI003FD4517B